MREALPEYTDDFCSPHFYPTVEPIPQDAALPVNQRFNVPGLIERMQQASDCLFIDSAQQQSLGLDSFLLRGAAFNWHQEWELGRSDSAHNVFFGELNLTVDQGLSGEEHAIPVAVKPYHLAFKDAVHEFVSYRQVNHSGFIDSFEPLGIWLDSERRAFLLTLFEPDVISLDNTSWQKEEEDSLSEHFQPMDALTLSAHILALLHMHGFTHGDAQIKNMAKDDTGVRLIDLTQLRRFVADEETVVNEDHLRLKISDDLSTLVQSVQKRNYLNTSSSERKKQMISAAVVGPYLSAMLHPSARIFNNHPGTADMVNLFEATDTVLGML